MASQVPKLARKPPGKWDRLKPAKQDPLDSVGFVSRGDNKLLDAKAQEAYYSKIVARYMQFCTQHGKDLDQAFASLLRHARVSILSDAAQNPPVSQNSAPTAALPSAASKELSNVLLALRKLREALLATSSTAPSPTFSQRVHVFNIRMAILAMHPPSYHPPLVHLLSQLHTKRHPLSSSELNEMVTYLILDLACRQDDIASAFRLRAQCKIKCQFESAIVDGVLLAMASDNWVMFWSLRRKVDGYVRALLYWYVERLRKRTLKAIGRAYMACDAEWIVQSATGGEMTWDELVEEEDIGWLRDGERVVIRKPKPKPVEAC